jgi:hypothetical protein
MLRVVFIILAIVAITLAFVLGQAVLYLVAVALLAGAVALMTRKLKKQHSDIPESFMKAPMPPEVDLSSLGIIDIRPKASRSKTTVANQYGQNTSGSSESGSMDPDLFSRNVEVSSSRQPERHREIAQRDHPTPVLNIEPQSELMAETSFSLSEDFGDTDTIVSPVRTRVQRTNILVSDAASRYKTSVLLPALTSLRASMEAHTVCLLRQSEKPIRYHIEAIVSLNSYARGQGSFVATEPLLAGFRPFAAVVIPRVGEDGFTKRRLGYYHEPISVRQVSMVPISARNSASEYILVADTMNQDGFESAASRSMIEQFAGLLGTLISSEQDAGDGAPVAPKTVRPRREIIREEMEQARRLSSPLSLAMVFLNRGETMAGADDDVITYVENQFEMRLKAVANDAMVEHFGELTFGIFYHGQETSVGAWAGNIQATFDAEEGDLDGGVSVGVAIMRDRHLNADDLRSDATAALKQAFDSGECTIVE